MYIRLTEGRDRGEVKEFPFVESQEMIAQGKAIKVDLTDPNWQEKNLDFLRNAEIASPAQVFACEAKMPSLPEVPAATLKKAGSRFQRKISR